MVEKFFSTLFNPPTGAVVVPFPQRARVASFRELCDTFDYYRLNTAFEELGAGAFPMVTSMDLTDLTLRSLYNPATTVVDFYVGHTLTGKLIRPPAKVLERDQFGPAPDDVIWPITSNQRLIEPLLKLWHWSNRQLMLQQYTGMLATYGNALIIVTETLNPEPRVITQFLHPACLTAVTFDSRGYITNAEITTEEATDPGSPNGRFAIQERVVRTYSKVEYTETRSSGSTRRWPNPHGFVPVVLARHTIKSMQDWGLNSFHHVLPQINNLCLVASILSQNVTMHTKARWMVFGASAPDASETIEADNDFWYFPGGSSAEVMIPKLPIEAVIGYIKNLVEEVEKRCPELTLAQIGDRKRDVSGAAVRGLASAIVERGMKARGNYQHGMVQADMMALSMGMNLGGTGLNIWEEDLGRFSDLELDHSYHWPDIIPLTRTEQLRAEAEERDLLLQIAIAEAQLDYARRHGEDSLLELAGIIQAPAPPPPPAAADVTPQPSNGG